MMYQLLILRSWFELYFQQEFFSVLGGHSCKGFLCSWNFQLDRDPRIALIWKWGTRFSVNKIRGEFILYQNDYKNLLGSDLAASGGTGELDPFNAEVRHWLMVLNFLLMVIFMNDEKVRSTVFHCLTHLRTLNFFVKL